MSSDINFERRLYLLLVIGSTPEKTLEQLEILKNGFLKEFKETITYGNTIFFVSEKDVPTLGKDVQKDFLGTILGHMIVDITDNLNPYDFIANITEHHSNSKELVDLFKSFLQTPSKVEEEKLTLEQQLEYAISAEDYELASEIRDEILEKSKSSIE